MPLFENYCDPVTAGSAMVAAAHPLAATVGLNILKIGGNAMDACLAMAGVTMVVLPQMCGLGGDAFFIYYEAKTRTAVAVNGSGPAGDQATVHQFKDKGRILPQDGIYSIAVPGAPMVYDSAERRFSVLGLEKCFEPAVMIAEKVFPYLRGYPFYAFGID